MQIALCVDDTRYIAVEEVVACGRRTITA